MAFTVKSPRYIFSAKKPEEHFNSSLAFFFSSFLCANEDLISMKIPAKWNLTSSGSYAFLNWSDFPDLMYPSGKEPAESETNHKSEPETSCWCHCRHNLRFGNSWHTVMKELLFCGLSEQIGGVLKDDMVWNSLFFSILRAAFFVIFGLLGINSRQ